MNERPVTARATFPWRGLRGAIWCALCFTLLTCTPPNFDDDPPTGDQLTIFPLEPQLVAGNQVDFTAEGGDPPHVFSIVSGTGTINATTGLFTAADQPGTTTVKVTDDGGIAVQTTVNVLPADLVLSPDTVTIFEGASVVITAHGGTMPYYGSVNGGGDLTKTSDTTWRFDSNDDNPTPWEVTVTDSTVPTAKTRHSYIKVNPPPVALTISPDTITLTLGETFQFSAGGGTPAYTYDLASGVGSIASGGLYTASQIGSAEVRVRDAAMDSDIATVTVEALPLQINPTFINLAFNTGFDFDATGGQAPYVFSIFSGGISGTIVPSTGVFTALAMAGTVVVQVQDSLPSAPSQATVNVYAPLAISPDPATVDAAATKTFSATGGVPGYTFALVSGVGEIHPTTGIYTAPPSPGSAVVKVTDSIGNIDQTTVTVVDPAEWIPPITVDTGGGQHASLILASGTAWPNIAYQSGTSLKFAKGTGSTTFALETVSTSDSGDYPGQYASLALNPSNSPRIGYYYSKTNHWGLGYSSWDGAQWNPSGKLPGTDGLNVGQYASLALDPTDSYHPRIAYYDARTANLDLALASFDGSTWTLEPVDTDGDVGRFASLRIDDSGDPHIAYYDATNGELAYAWWESGTWHYETIDTAGNVGQYASLALDSSGFAHIAYYDVDDGSLLYAHEDSGGWKTPEIVDGTGDVGKYASLAIDSSGNPRIAYYDATNSSLKYASWNDAASVWVVATIDNAADVGRYASLALDGSNKMRIAYYDASNNRLKYIAQQ